MLRELVEKESEAKAALDASKKALTEVQAQIQEIINEPVLQVRNLQKKDTGTVSVDIDGITVKHTLAKTVVWDQKTLKEVFTRIQSAGDDPENYMEMKLTVPERKYGSFDPAIRAAFDPARTVKTGSPKIEFVGV